MKPPARSMHERLSAVAPALPQAVLGPAPIDDLDRILALPRRAPFDCQPDPETRRYRPETRALVEEETARLARPARSSCACLPRQVTRIARDLLAVARVMPPGEPPQPPRVIALADFLREHTDPASPHASETDAARRVQSLAVGERVDLPAVDGGTGYPCVVELNPPQAWALREARSEGGLVAYLGVGTGKSYVFMLAPLLFPGARCAVLCHEPKQRRHYRTHYLRLREHFRVPTIVFDDSAMFTVPGTVPLYLVSYSVLSRNTNSDLLEHYKPEVLMLDEGHRACGDSAINRRVKRYIPDRLREREEAISRGEAVRPRAVYFLCGSGTLESKSVKDTQMLSAFALGTGSPLPLKKDKAIEWSAVFDPQRLPDRKSTTARRLYQAFGGGVTDYDASDDFADLIAGTDTTESALRRGFCEWRRATPGIVTASTSAVNASLSIAAKEAPPIPIEIQAALDTVRAGQRPDGVWIDERMHQVTCAREVAAGFYTYWAFPKHPCAKRPGQDECKPRCDQCLLIDDWFARRKVYSKALRRQVHGGQPHMDSPDLCWQAAERALRLPASAHEVFCATCREAGLDVRWPCADREHRPAWRCEAWGAWRAIEGRVEYDERVKWLDDYLARDAAEWAQKNTGIVWFRSTAFGRRVAELADIEYFNGGPGCEDRLAALKGDRSIACSVKALGAGTDGLQYKYSEQLVAEFPASNGGAEGAEQLLGRLHRLGQRADRVNTLGYFHTEECLDAIRQVLVEARFHREMQDLQPKMLLADLDVPDL